MLLLLRNKYFIGFTFVYFLAVAILYFGFHQSFWDLATVFISFGLALSLAAWMLVKNIAVRIHDKPSFKSEIFLLCGFVLFFAWYVTYGSSQINKLIPSGIIAVAGYNAIAILVKKLLVFVLIPLSIYRAFGFTMKDFGVTKKINEIFTKKNLSIFFILSVLTLLFQYFFSNGAKPFHEQIFSNKQLFFGLPALFLWLFIEVGLVEEFFFRALLQARIAMLLKSQTAGIIISGIIFGLAHAPGLYLRGAESEGVTEQLPFIFWAAYTIAVMSLAGIFLGIVWARTKNLWLVMALHAMVDLLPSMKEFVQTWHI